VEQIDVFFEKFLSAHGLPKPSIIDIAQSARNVLINTQIGKRAFQVGHKHYDLGNDMYQLMLGESMGYSSALFNGPNQSLTGAQYNKFDTLCKKLKLQPGMKVLEICAGWGTFARHAAAHYGVEVVGLTVSKEQKAFAEKRCEGLPVKFILVDYRKLPRAHDNTYDRVVSIEMIEAVGKKNMRGYFSVINRVLKLDGLAGLQAIVGSGKDDAFLSTRIFPNGHVPSLTEIARGTDGLLRLIDWHSFGSNYDRTLLAWDANFRKHWNKIKNLTNSAGEQLYDEAFYRMWRYYLLVCAASFRIGFNDVAQLVFAKSSAPATSR
jgi:cyclopropane-fatty-acyl-phospholipid synthase